MTGVLMTAATTTEGQTAAPTQATAQAAPAQQPQTSTQQQPQASQAPAQQAAQAPATETGQPQGTPGVYEFKAPEGMSYDQQVLGTYTEVAKELGLSQEAAQKMLDRLAPALQQRTAEQVTTISNEWAEQARSDKEFGGDKLAENLSVAKKALDAFGGPQLVSLLNESGLGNHPELIRFFYRAGKAISGDRFVTGSSGAGKGVGVKDFASVLYSNQSSLT
jgi:FtsZ-interacting cell division protein ZipA